MFSQQAVKIGEFTLSSGAKSNFYIDGKQITLHPEGLHLMSEIILEKIKDSGAQYIGGMTIGADPIAGAVSALSSKTDNPIPGFIVRKTQKAHGLQKKIEGIIKPNSKVVVLDDVITRGAATLEAIAAVEEIGCKVVKIVCLVDRQEGGKEALSKYELDPIFKKEELLK